MKSYYAELIKQVREKNLSKSDLARLKIKLCYKYKLKQIPTDIEVLLNAENEGSNGILKLLQTKPVRSISGVAPIAIMTKPIACKHGTCVFCPGGPDSFFGDVPQSYTGHEPSTMRGIRNHYDPYLMVMNRLEQYAIMGHNFDKVELIIMGGTFPSFPMDYQNDFVTYSLKALNDFGRFYNGADMDMHYFKEFFELPGDIKNFNRESRIQNRLLKLKGTSTLEFEQARNENAKIRCTAMVIETKPDWCLKHEINTMLKFGTTRVEVGIQHLDENILRKTNRGHGIRESIECTQLMRDALLKITYHMMPGLPGSTIERDNDVMREIFSNPDYKPDALKIYPCMVSPGTALHSLWKAGKFNPITTEEAAKIIAGCKKYVPRYCRIMRVQRDIPPKYMSAGVGRSNLRQYVDIESKKLGIKCQCIRCREPKNRIIDWNNVRLNRINYDAGLGDEIFISFDDLSNDIILGFCRLRIPCKSFRPEITEYSAGVRELHVYGHALKIGGSGNFSGIQHRGIGEKLLDEAERIATDEYDKKKMVVISGIGAREYYKKFGYNRAGVYMVKHLKV